MKLVWILPLFFSNTEIERLFFAKNELFQKIIKNYNISSKIDTYPRNVHIFMKKWKKLTKSVKITKIDCKMVKSAIFHEIYFIFWKFNSFTKIWKEIMWNPANERFSCHHSFPNKVKVICITVFLKSYFQNGVNFQFFKKTGRSGPA